MPMTVFNCARCRARCQTRRLPRNLGLTRLRRAQYGRSLRRRQPRIPMGTCNERRQQTFRSRRLACKRATLGRSDRSYSAERPTCSYRTRTIGSPAGNFPIPGSAQCAHAPGRHGQSSVLRNGGSLPTEPWRPRTRASVSESRTSAGWAAGVEVSLMANWTARAEYLYVDLNDRSFVLTGAKHGIELSRLRIGVDCRF